MGIVGVVLICCVLLSVKMGFDIIRPYFVNRFGKRSLIYFAVLKAMTAILYVVMTVFMLIASHQAGRIDNLVMWFALSVYANKNMVNEIQALRRILRPRRFNE